MLQPGSKGWISKYFFLVEKGLFNLLVRRQNQSVNDSFIHANLGRTGIVFGYPTRLLFAKSLDDSKWTTEEKLKILLFEAHLFVYQCNIKDKDAFSSKEFISKLLTFYGNYNESSISKLVSYFLKESEEDKLDTILEKRVDIKIKLLDNQFWVNYLNNVFIYLDVILFHDFLNQEQTSSFYNYDELALNALNAITMASYSDGFIEQSERLMFNVFLASANLPDIQRNQAEERFKQGGEYHYFTEHLHSNWLMKRFVLDLSVFVVFANHAAANEEKIFLNELCQFLMFSNDILDESMVLTQQFIISNQDKIPFLQSSSSVEKVYNSLSKRWIKILGRNKDKLAIELKQSKELVLLIRKATVKELSKEEKELVKTQFLDIVKTMPSLAIFMLPGGAFLLPLVLKIIPDLIPSAFRDNYIERE